MQRPRLPDYHQTPEPDDSAPWWKKPRASTQPEDSDAASPDQPPERAHQPPRDPNAVYLDTPHRSGRTAEEDTRTRRLPAQDAADPDAWDPDAWDQNAPTTRLPAKSGAGTAMPGAVHPRTPTQRSPKQRAPEQRPGGSGGRSGGPGSGGPGSGGSGSGGKRGGKPRRRRSLPKRILGWSAFTVIALLVITGVYATWSYNTLTSHITHLDLSSIQKPATDIDGGAQNILLVGDDQRPTDVSPQVLAQLQAGVSTGENNTDTMMILHVPADGSAATVISLPRDSWVKIPGNGMGKLNSAYADGVAAGGNADGAKLLVQTVQNLTGLTIDHYVQVSLYGFYTVAKALGPIQVCLKNAVNDPYSGADFPAGTSTLDAEQALAFVRQRHGLPLGDLDREIRQQYFLSVAAHKLLSPATLLNPWALNSVLSAAGSAVTTDSNLNLLDLAFKLKSLNGIHSATIPVAGTPTIYVDGSAVSIVRVDTAAMPGFIQSVIGQPTAYEKATAATPSDVTVTVLNGGSTNGAATDATGVFAKAGFHTGTPGNTNERATTVVQYPAGQEAKAKAVAALLPGAGVEQAGTGSGVTVLLGDDGIMPAAPSHATTGGSSSGGSGGSGGSSSSGAGSGSSGGAASPTSKFSSASCIN